MQLQHLLECCEFDVRSYSGRGINGKECLAFVTDKTIGQIICTILYEVDEYFPDIAEAFDTMKSDNMGKSTIYYFPSIEYIEYDDDDDDE